MAHTFHYQTGEEVMIGDVVRYPEPFGVGVVKLFLEPFGEEAHRWNVPEDGVFMAFVPESPFTREEDCLKLGTHRAVAELRMGRAIGYKNLKFGKLYFYDMHEKYYLKWGGGRVDKCDLRKR